VNLLLVGRVHGSPRNQEKCAASRVCGRDALAEARLDFAWLILRLRNRPLTGAMRSLAEIIAPNAFIVVHDGRCGQIEAATAIGFWERLELFAQFQARGDHHIVLT